MIPSFRKLRGQLLQLGRVKQYLLYAIGEIVLIAIGILIAIQLDNLNQARLDRQIEKEILIGIRNDILNDTIDINANIKGYQFLIDNNFKILEFLLNKKRNDPQMGEWLRLSYTNFTLTLQGSHFEEAKQKGLSIISNTRLREEINRLYEFKYKYILFIENEYEPNDNFKALYPLINPYLQLESGKFNIDNVDSVYIPPILNTGSFKKLLEDKELHRKPPTNYILQLLGKRS